MRRIDGIASSLRCFSAVHRRLKCSRTPASAVLSAPSCGCWPNRSPGSSRLRPVDPGERQSIKKLVAERRASKEPPGPHVLRLFLHPDRPACRLDSGARAALQLVMRQRIELLHPHDRHVRRAAVRCAPFPARSRSCRCTAARLRRSVDRDSDRESPAGSGRGVKSSSGETPAGCRSRLLGVITTSGLRQGRTTCRRRQWKILRRRGGHDDLNVVVGRQSQEPLQPGATSARGPSPRSRAATAAPGR